MKLSTTRILVLNLSDVRNELRYSIMYSLARFLTPTDLQLLQALTKVFVNAIVTSTKKMPYGMRCIAREMLLELRVCIRYGFCASVLINWFLGAVS